MTFPEFLRAEVAKRGQAKVAEICGVTTRTVQRWLKGPEAPNKATEAGARLLLTKAP